MRVLWVRGHTLAGRPIHTSTLTCPAKRVQQVKVIVRVRARVRVRVRVWVRVRVRVRVGVRVRVSEARLAVGATR